MTTQLGRGGDLSTVKDEDMNQEGGWKCLDPGWYRAMVFHSDYGPTNAGDGNRLELRFKFLDDGLQHIEKRDYLTLEHPNQKTVQIARTRLKELAVAVGHPSPDRVDDSQSLHSVPLMVRLGVQAASNPKYGDRNGNENRIYEYMSVQAYRAKHGGKPAMQSASQALAPGREEPPPLEDDDIPF